MTEASTPPEPELKSLRDRPFELLAQLERRGRAVSAQVSQEEAAGREWVGVALRMAGDLYLVAREETREVLGVPASTTRVPGARSRIKGRCSRSARCSRVPRSRRPRRDGARATAARADGPCDAARGGGGAARRQRRVVLLSRGASRRVRSRGSGRCAL